MKSYRRCVQLLLFIPLKGRSCINRTLQRVNFYKYRQLSDEESLDYLLSNKNVGIVRFGNSELSYAAGSRKDNQKQNRVLREKLTSILKHHHKAVSYVVGFPLDATILVENSSRTVKRSIWDRAPRMVVQAFAKTDYIYLSQFLFRLKNVITSDREKYLNKLRELFANRDIIYVGPEVGRNSSIWGSIKPTVVINIPENNAFDFYEKILKEVKKEARKVDDPLVLVVAGITGTALSADLNETGITTYDLGQLSRHVRESIHEESVGFS